jgi:hypothetical protein
MDVCAQVMSAVRTNAFKFERSHQWYAVHA